MLEDSSGRKVACLHFFWLYLIVFLFSEKVACPLFLILILILNRL